MTQPEKIGTRFSLTAKRCLWLGLVGIVLTLSYEIFTELDLSLQDHFYLFDRKEWLVNSRSPLPRFIFYNLPKILLFTFGGILLVAVFHEPLRRKFFKQQRPQLIYVLGCLGCVPLLVSAAKYATHVHCPSELSRYGGSEEYQKIISLHRTPYQQVRPHCFPAGHASGGFALFGLYFAHRRLRWLFPGLALGWTMGLYQMFKGAHFLSHTLTTMFLALSVCAALSLLLRSDGNPLQQ
ncbi:MAG TPA: phosphatase PAP2 family protein [Verrucomicrobiae bacterium]|nr:phosphatase PAP2 family protein [Verrucomicrobiae bacterium]